MLRQGNLKKIYNLRWNSTLANLTNELKAGKLVESSRIAQALSETPFASSETRLLHDILRLKIDNETANEVLCHGIPHDFSLYFTAVKEKHDLVWREKTLENLIKHNPGRVFSSVDLLEKHRGESTSDSVRLVVAEKLLLGEKSEASDTGFVPTDANISRAIGLLNEVNSLKYSEKLLKSLVEILAQKNVLAVLSMLQIDGFYEWINGTYLTCENDAKRFLPLSQLVFVTRPSILSKQTLGKILQLAGDAQEDFCPVIQNFQLEKVPITNKKLVERVLEYVEENRLDVDKKDPESLLLRLQLIQTYGIDHDNTDLALRKFHEYQSHEKFGIDLVQAKLVKAFCYQSFKVANETFLKIAETLINPTELAVSTIAQLILSKARFSSDKSLDLYNEYINRVSKDLNEVTKRSPTGILTESLMVACLYDNDREFAQLLYEKAIANGIISDELEIATMKKVFKVYGESFVDDDWKVAQPIFADYVLKSIKKL